MRGKGQPRCCAPFFSFLLPFFGPPPPFSISMEGRRRRHFFKKKKPFFCAADKNLFKVFFAVLFFVSVPLFKIQKKRSLLYLCLFFLSNSVLVSLQSLFNRKLAQGRQKARKETT